MAYSLLPPSLPVHLDDGLDEADNTEHRKKMREYYYDALPFSEVSTVLACELGFDPGVDDIIVEQCCFILQEEQLFGPLIAKITCTVYSYRLTIQLLISRNIATGTHTVSCKLGWRKHNLNV